MSWKNTRDSTLAVQHKTLNEKLSYRQRHNKRRALEHNIIYLSSAHLTIHASWILLVVLIIPQKLGQLFAFGTLLPVRLARSIRESNCNYCHLAIDPRENLLLLLHHYCSKSMMPHRSASFCTSKTLRSQTGLSTDICLATSEIYRELSTRVQRNYFYSQSLIRNCDTPIITTSLATHQPITFQCTNECLNILEHPFNTMPHFTQKSYGRMSLTRWCQ